ncbi:hypothetical protein AMAG_17808 [Allomyces macrogynus ATCC 38327]|uniref:Uncharacterized protein n=1 Tax=Allomyces macrogynus (strain ATCC 38327) TaxID=578462 RepID=A0A0L0S045_ALLM3|nr:hypothetical protein AMAG_17808 [Allomyces macrogynus ATCC 38327]|eukprot:KNE55699.1 hypothetical protein AMAG_17808 [Allomyces macrogynus ATCC 38327]
MPSAPALAPRLECLPDTVVNRIAELLLFRTALERHGESLGSHSLRYETGRLAVLYLALTAPSLYTPCLRAVIRTTTKYHRTAVLCTDGVTVRLPLARVGTFVWIISSKSGSSRGVQWSLVLPFRDQDRSYAGPSAQSMLRAKMTDRPLAIWAMSDRASLVDVSLQWSFLHLALDQLQYYMASDMTRVVPAHCRELLVCGRIDNILFSTNLETLHLRGVALPPAVDIQRVFQQLPNLRSLALINVTALDKNVATLASLAVQIPISIIALELRLYSGFPDTFVAVLADRIQSSLMGIKSLTVHGCSPTLLARIIAVLPRTGMHKLTVGIDVKNENDLLACSTLLAKAWPTSVSAFCFTLTNSIGSSVLISEQDVMPAVAANLPFVTRLLDLRFAELSLRVPTFQQLPLAPTLTHLSLHASGKDLDGLGLEALMLRLPSALKDLSLRSWALGGSSTATIFGSRLPAHLEALSLYGCDLTDQDLAQFVFPASIRYLNLEENQLGRLPAATLPARLQTLVLKRNRKLSDGMVEWVAALPTTLHTLDVSHTALGDHFAATLLQRMPAPRVTLRMSVNVAETTVSEPAKQQLSVKFNVIDFF